MTQQNRTEIVISALNETEAAFRQIKSSFAELSKDLDTAKARFSSLSSVMASIGAGLSLGAVAAWLKGTIDAADELNKMSQKVGVSVESLSELKYAGDLADVSLEQLGVGLRQLSKNMFGASQGSKEQAQSFKDLGVAVVNTDGTLRSTEDVFKDIADRFSNMEDGGTKTAQAMKVFGKSGADLIPLLNAGKNGLNDMAKEARALGVVFSGESARAAEQFNDNLTTLKTSFAGIGVGIVNNVIMPLMQFIKATMQAQVTWMAFMDKLELVNRFKWSGLIGSKKEELKRQLAIVDEAAFGQINEIEARFTSAPKIKPAGGSGGASGGGSAGTSGGRAKKQPAPYDLSVAKREGGLYDWRDIVEATEVIGNFRAQLKAPELRQPIFNLGFTAVEFETMEQQQERATDALRQQQEELSQTSDSLRELAKLYDDTFGIKIPSALEGAQAALVEYGRVASDSTSNAFAFMYRAFGGLEDSLVNFVTTGKASFKDLVDSILADVARMTIQKSITGPLSGLISGALKSWFGGGSGSTADIADFWMNDRFMENANGNVFASPSLSRYSGTVVNKPTFFKFAMGGALGVMGESSDPEGIFPLARDKSGKLGVRAMGGGSSLTINIPLTVHGDGKKLASELRRDIEDLVENKVRDMV